MGQFYRGIVTTYALEIGVAADGDNGHQSLTAFLAARCSIHKMILPDIHLTRNGNLCSTARYRRMAPCTRFRRTLIDTRDQQRPWARSQPSPIA